MRMRLLALGFLICAALATAQPASLPAASAPAVPPLAISPAQLVHEVVFNELNDHQRHGYWRYWVARRTARELRVEEQVETPDGPVGRLQLVGGHPLEPSAREQERVRLDSLLHSSDEQARLRRDHAEDERRIGRIVALLPDAFLYELIGETGGCYRLRFRPNPVYPARSIEARIFHAMSGELWVDARAKRMARLEGHLIENVDFGYGLLGRLYKGGWFLLERTAAGGLDWKTARLEVHMSGRAMLFKTIARETSEERGGFTAVRPNLSLAEAVALLESPSHCMDQLPPAVGQTPPAGRLVRLGK